MFWEKDESLSRWRSLLESPDQANRKVAIMLAAAHNLPDTILDDFIIEKLTHDDRQQVNMGVELAVSQGLAMDVLYFRFLVVGTVGTSYGWVKPFLNEKQKLTAGTVFKKVGYGTESHVPENLSIIEGISPEVNVGRIAYWLCAAKEIRQRIRRFAFGFLVDNHMEEWIEKSLPFFMNKSSLNLAFLNQIPEAVYRLSSITGLSVSGGNPNLNGFPERITELTHLEALRLSVNGIRTIPESIGKLAKLRVLDVSYNPIQALPESLAEIGTLETIALTLPMLSDTARTQLENLRVKRPNLIIENKIA
ncbi:MAG: leucine-rich repeat domain-containing protein [Bacteroidia bacterium]